MDDLTRDIIRKHTTPRDPELADMHAATADPAPAEEPAPPASTVDLADRIWRGEP